MNKFNVESAKFLSIIIGICLIFIMVVWHAFEYIPNKGVSNKPVEEAVVQEELVDEEKIKVEDEQTVEEVVLDEEMEDSERESTEQIIIEQRRQDIVKEKLEPLESIEDSQGEIVAEKQEEISFVSILNQGQDKEIAGDYSGALAQYQKALDMVSSNKEKAICLEKIAMLYALQKRYGSALSVAQKAYNAYPNTSREILLARLYYKTGDINRANARMSNVLKRDFMANDK